MGRFGGLKTLCLFWFGIGYGFRGNYGSVHVPMYLSFSILDLRICCLRSREKQFWEMFQCVHRPRRVWMIFPTELLCLRPSADEAPRCTAWGIFKIGRYCNYNNIFFLRGETSTPQIPCVWTFFRDQILCSLNGGPLNRSVRGEVSLIHFHI